MSFYSGNEFKRTKRFGHIIIRSQGQPCNFIRFLVLSCQHDNGVCVFFPDFLAEGKSAYIGKHNIKNCKVKFFLLNTSQSVLCRVKFIYDVILGFILFLFISSHNKAFHNLYYNASNHSLGFLHSRQIQK